MPNLHNPAASAYQRGIGEGNNDVGVKVIRVAPLYGPDASGVPRQWRDSNLCCCKTWPQHPESGSGAPATHGVQLGDLFLHQVCHLRKAPSISVQERL